MISAPVPRGFSKRNRRKGFGGVSLPDDIGHRTAVSNVLVALELKACLSGGFKETRA